jgi:RNA-directed DNA polymerase
MPWARLPRQVFPRHTRMSHATRRGEGRPVRRRQGVRRPAWAAQRWAVRRLAQAQRGQRTAGGDGVPSFTPSTRCALAPSRRLDGTAAPVRRGWRPPAGSTPAHRPWGSPSRADSARQTGVTVALAPAGAARCDATSDGVRPGRAGHEARTAMGTAMGPKAPEVLAAASAKGSDSLEQAARLAKGHARPSRRRPRRAGLPAGGLDRGPRLPPDAGPRQGRPWSPWRAHRALHGLATALTPALPGTGSRNRPPPQVVVYADDLVLLPQERASVDRGQARVAAWRRPMGRGLPPRNTRLSHPREPRDGPPGCDCRRVHRRPFPGGTPPSGRNGRGRWQGFNTILTPSRTAIRTQRTTWRQTIGRPNQAVQHRLRDALTSRRRGGSTYDRPVARAQALRPWDNTLYRQRRAGALRRHAQQAKPGSRGQDGRVDEGHGGRCQPPPEGGARTDHAKTSSQYQVKGKGTRSPYKGDGGYGSPR